VVRFSGMSGAALGRRRINYFVNWERSPLRRHPAPNLCENEGSRLPVPPPEEHENKARNEVNHRDNDKYVEETLGLDLGS